MAVVAGDQPLIDPVMERLGEIGFDVLVAPETKLGHGCLQQVRLNSRRMDGVAVNATYVVLDVFRAQEVRVLLPELMAAQAAFGGLFARQPGKADDLVGFRGPSRGLAGPVAGLASLPLRSLMFRERGFPVWALVITGCHLLMTRFAGLRAHVLRRIDRLICLFDRSVFLGVLLF